MKNLKKVALGLIIGALAMGFSAFTTAKNVNHAKFADKWFQLKSTVTPTKMHALDPTNYDAPEDAPPCSLGTTYCGVEATNNSGQPDLGSSTPANTQINAYFNTGTQGARISAEN